MGATYDANGRLSKVSYPSGFTARYGYNSLGDANQLLDDVTSQVHWTANAMDAEQHLTQQTAGNGLVTTRSFDVATGRLTAIGTGAGSAVQNLAYTFDRLGNPLSRTDGNTNLAESFSYDALNRLTSATVSLSPTPLAKTFTYDAVGNLTSKSDVGSYSYAPPGSPLPHAVMSVSGGTISTTFSYDPNGNQTGGLNRAIAYTSYNKPASITQGARTISFLDDVDHQRFKQVTPEGTTLYIAGFGVLAELSGPGTTAAKWTDYLSVGNAKVGMRVLQAASETLNLRYFHTDHLGSISVITNESGVVQERLSFDAWGKRRNPDGSDDTAGSITSQTTRGFTGQEELSVAGLVHLNGRVYDPLLARMTSPDPTVARPLSSQGWSRYSYVAGRPLAFVDPSGFEELPPIFVSPSPGFGEIVPGVGPTCCVVIGNSPYFPSLSQQVANTANAIINAPLPVIPSLLVPPPVSTPWVGPNVSVDLFIPYTPAAAPSVANPASVASAASPSTMLPAITVDAPSARNLVEPRGKSRGSSFVGAGGAGFAFTTDAYAYVSGTLHWGLTAGSFAPSLIGSAFSLGDAGLYALEGDGTGAAISLGAAVVGIAFDAGAVKLAAEAAKEAMPLIKAGSAGGATAGKAFPQAIKDAANAENPLKICVYCRRDGVATQVDHAIPKAQGGNATLDNAQLACPHCNTSKGARDFPVNPPQDYFGKWPPTHWGD